MNVFEAVDVYKGQLLDNAVKYTPSGGKISVSVVQWEMYVEVKVTDTGKGISENLSLIHI